MNIRSRSFSFLGAALTVSLLSACGNDSGSDFAGVPTVPAPTPPPVMQEYKIDIVNLTAGQIFSPVAVVAHSSIYRVFRIGDVATVGLEMLAEGGDNSAFIIEADADSAVMQTLSAGGPTMPGVTESLTIMIDENDVPGAELSGLTMLINSNDGMTAFHGLQIDTLAVGDSVKVTTISYDSGTEANSEDIGTIPGPADGGEGFNTVRDDVMDMIRGHSGVVTADDGLLSSTLNQMHRWDNPVASVMVTRMK